MKLQFWRKSVVVRGWIENCKTRSII
jgi:hypothetical protein